MRLKNRIPSSPEAWLHEIADAYLDAREAIPFGIVVGQSISESELFHMAPAVCLKFRGIRKSERLLQKATDAALTSYVSTRDRVGTVLDVPQVAFAFCYLAAHFGLDLLDEAQVGVVMDYIEKEAGRLVEMTRGKCS